MREQNSTPNPLPMPPQHMNPPHPEPFLRIQQVAAYLNTPVPTVREWAKSGKLQYYKPGKPFLFLLSDVTAFMALYRRRSDDELLRDREAKTKELDTLTAKTKRS